MYVCVRAELYPILFAQCQQLLHPLYLERLFKSESFPLSHFCFGRNKVCVFVCVCVYVCVVTNLFISPREVTQGSWPSQRPV